MEWHGVGEGETLWFQGGLLVRGRDGGREGGSGGRTEEESNRDGKSVEVHLSPAARGH